MRLYSHRSWMRSWNDEMRVRKMDASAATPESYTSQSSSVEWLPPPSPSPPTLHPSAFALHLGLGAMTGPSIISTDWSLLIAIAVNYLDFAEIAHWRRGRPKRERYCRPNKLHITHMKPRPIMKTTAAEAELCRSMKQSRETGSSYLVLW